MFVYMVNINILFIFKNYCEGVLQLAWLSNLPHITELSLEQSSRYGISYSDISPLCYLKMLKTLKLDIKIGESALTDIAKLKFAN